MSGAPKASTSSPAFGARRRAPELAAPGAPAPEVVMHGRVEVVFYPGPLPRRDDAPLTQVELDFRWLAAGEVVLDQWGAERVEVRPEFHEWSERVRVAWEAENVIWFHGYADGKPIWRRERPPPDVEPPKAASKAGKPNALPRCKLRTPEEREHTHDDGKKTGAQTHRERPR